jgi:hypothetical protein
LQTPDPNATTIHRARVPVEGMQSCEVCGNILIDLTGAVSTTPGGGRFWPARALVEVWPNGAQGIIEVGAPTCSLQEEDPAVLRRLLARANAIIADQRRTIDELARQGSEVRAALDETRGQLARAAIPPAREEHGTLAAAVAVYLAAVDSTAGLALDGSPIDVLEQAGRRSREALEGLRAALRQHATPPGCCTCGATHRNGAACTSPPDHAPLPHRAMRGGRPFTWTDEDTVALASPLPAPAEEKPNAR